MCEESDVLKVEVPLICPSTEGVPALREGRYLETTVGHNEAWFVSPALLGMKTANRNISRGLVRSPLYTSARLIFAWMDQSVKNA